MATATSTSFNPLPQHISAMQQDDDYARARGAPTPTYGGAVETGAEWDFIIDKYGRKSREPSRSPARSHGDRTSSLAQDREQHPPSAMSNPPITPPTVFSASGSRPASASVSAYPIEPTIREESIAMVNRSLNARQPALPTPSSSISPRKGKDAMMQTSTSGSSLANGLSSAKTRAKTRMVGDWQLGKTLGAGSMGKVKLATNAYSKERCAVKIIPRYTEDTRREHPNTPEEAEKQRQKDESKETRTIREAAISMLLHHPYICGMREIITHTNHHYMVFEMVDGGQMLDYIISHGRLRERAARKFARQIASALDYCHRNSIVHRDLKIENILISKNGNIKIIDFGLSNLYAPGRHLSTFCGSLYFAAPELLNAKVYTGPEVDVWSFGIVLYVLVCGKVPFDDQSMPALHAKIKRGLVEYPAWLSQECKSLLSRMLVTNPAERATLAEVMVHPFMTKGYEGAADSHLIHREPLRADDLDGDIINSMGGFTFGSPDQIYEELRAVLQSEHYLSTVAIWESRRDRRRGPGASSSTTALSDSSDSPKKKRFSGFDLKKKLFREEKKMEEPITRKEEIIDPTRGFDPLISIYFLAREKKERERVYGRGHFASSQTSVVDPTPNANSNQQTPSGTASASGSGTGFGMTLPGLPPPASTHAMGYEPVASPAEYASIPRERARAGTAPGEMMDIPNAVMQHPMAEQATSHIADIPSAHRHGRQPSLSQPPFLTTTTSTVTSPAAVVEKEDTFSRRFGFLGRGKNASSDSRPSSSSRNVTPNNNANVGIQGGVTPSPSMPMPTTAAASMAMDPRPTQPKHERRVSVGSVSSSASRSIARRGSQAERERTVSLKPSTATGASGSAGGSGAGRTGFGGWSSPRGQSSTSTSTSPTKTLAPPRFDNNGNQGDNFEEDRDAEVEVETETEVETEVPATTTAGDADIKSVYLKGLFSVSTTSTKPAKILLRDISAVLLRLGIKNRPIRGGYECVYIPSIDLASVNLNPDEVPKSGMDISLSPPMSSSAGVGGGGSRRRASFKRQGSKNAISKLGGSRNPSPNGAGAGTGLGARTAEGSSSGGLSDFTGTATATTATSINNIHASGNGNGNGRSSDSPVMSDSNGSGDRLGNGNGNGPMGTPASTAASTVPTTTPGSGGRPSKLAGSGGSGGGGGGGIDEDEDMWAMVEGGGARSRLMVRFELCVVKVPWLPLHGIQFRRVGGDGWQYQMLAKTILREMRL